MGKVMYSYDVEDKTISLSCMAAYPTSHLSLWEGDTLESENQVDKIVVRSSVTMDDDDDDEEEEEVELNESRLLNLPFHLLEMIMDHCIGVEYMGFRATCKRCHLAAPLMQWKNNKTRLRSRKYSLVSPWLMVVDKNRGRITFTDPVSGDKYFMKRSHVSIRRDKIHCSRFGWLLLCSNYSPLVFFNPFTNVICELPYVNAPDGFDSLCFSAPPTSRDCMVVGFRARGKHANVYIHSEQTWRVIGLDFGGARFCFPTFCGRDVFVLCDKGEVYVFKNLFKSQGCYYKKVVSRKRQGGECFLVKSDRQFLLIVVGDFGEYVEVLKLNCRNKEWEKVESLGRYMIYIDGTTCLCVEAKAPELENKIFFPRLHSKNGKIVFYSLETCNYHTFNGSSKNIQQIAGVGIKHAYSHAWIQPTWS
ncbi:F-box/kelch-repeat protein At1g57790 [Helianthus annuus]|nr:F-box/kelch-repeat protein At1g57790 [Helianthus annuus]